MDDNRYQEEVQDVMAPHRFFAFKSANEWMKDAEKMPLQRKLFGELWFENEACVLFAETNSGKSILAVQIAESISSGRVYAPFDMTAGAQKVLYFDFELCERQFSVRYTIDGQCPYCWSENLIRVEIDADAEYPNGDWGEYVCEQIEAVMLQAGARVGIIDNITYLGEELEKSKGALPLMKRLKEIKKRNNFSFLILAHCPKRNASRPLTKNDLQGSMMIMNFVDSAFSIGMSRQGMDVRYIKQLKARNNGIVYGKESVLAARIVKDYNFLRFDFLDTTREVEHLEQADPMKRDEQMCTIQSLYDDGESARSIATELGLSHTTVNRYLKELFDSGRVKKRGTGTETQVTEFPDVPGVPAEKKGGKSGTKRNR